jgi:enoyl-CoA hydratase/carnithine racemase
VMLCSADMRVLGEDAILWWPEYEVGLRAFGRTVDLVAAFGPARATELMLMGKEAALDAETAYTLGFANRVVAPEETDETAREMAHTIASTDQAHGTVNDYMEVLQLAREELTGTSRIHAQRMREQGGMFGY